MTPVFSSAWMRLVVLGLAEEARFRNHSWVGWYRELSARIELFISISESPKGWDLEDDSGEIARWIDAQPDDAVDCGWHGAIHALYVQPLKKLRGDFEHSLCALSWMWGRK